MALHDAQDNKDFGLHSQYADRIGIIHTIDDVNTAGKIAVICQNQFFEKSNGIGISVDPTIVSQNIELWNDNARRP
jgi:hypothetical protein